MISDSQSVMAVAALTKPDQGLGLGCAGSRAWRLRVVAFLGVLALLASILWHFHDRFWAPSDDGAYAHVAERILAGEVLNRDVQDIHPGYINFVNALALKLFGLDLVSFRYPLIVMAFLQAALVFWLTIERGVWIAAAAALSLTSLSPVQFLNPSAHWYCLFFVILTIGCLTWWPQAGRLRFGCLGFLVMTVFLFRQLSGVITGIGLLAYLLAKPSGPDAHKGSALFARLLCVIMAAGLALYILTNAGFLALALYGTWPLGLLACVGARTTVSNRDVLRFLSWMALGGLVASAPLLVYHGLNGSLEPWFKDTVVCALSLTRLDFIRSVDYLTLSVAGLHKAITSSNASAVVNGLFWFVLPLVGPTLGCVVLRSVHRDGSGSPGLAPLPFLAVFYSITSLHFQIHIYLYFSVGLCFVGLLWMLSRASLRHRRVCVAIAVLFSAVALYYHAAQPLHRRILEGQRIALVPNHGLDRCSLWIGPQDAELYPQLVALTDRECGPCDAILAIPFSPELYFLTRRRNPFRFFNTALGIIDQQGLSGALETLTSQPPKLVFYRPQDKYNTHYSLEMMRFVRQHYELLQRTGGFEIYRYRTVNE